MNRQYPLETLLLSRSYSSKEKVIELLQTRYAPNERPPQLNLNLTTSVKRPADNRSILRKIKDKKALNNDSTKQSFKNYIKATRTVQKHLKKQVGRYQDKEVGLKQIMLTKDFEKIPKYEEFLNLNALWVEYIQDLLQIDKLPTAPNVTQQQQVLNKLASADFNGCFLQVLKSSDKTIIGKSGIVVWDAKNFFIIIQDEVIDTLKLIPKKNSVFNFVIPVFKIDDENQKEEEYLEFSIIGSRFQFKASDRSGKKFKSRNVDDLSYLS